MLLVFGLSTTLFVGVAQEALGHPTPVTTNYKRTPLNEANEKTKIVSRLQYIFLVISAPTLGSIKLSVLCFYRRIFVIETRNMRNFYNMLYILMICMISLWTAGFMLAFIFACKGKFSAWWASASSLIANCVDTLELFFSFAVSDFITDAIVILLPIPRIIQLRLPTERKLGVLVVFLLGILATVASMIRMIWVIWARKVGFDVTLDVNLLITTSLFWNMLEASLGIIAACLPMLPGVLSRKSMGSMMQSVWSRIRINSRDSSCKDEEDIRVERLHNKDTTLNMEFVTLARCE